MNKTDSSSLPPFWEKLRVGSTMLASVLIPLVIAVSSQSYTSTLKQNEIGARYVEMAINILKEPPDPKTESLRKWAIDVVNYHSEVPLTEKALIELQIENLSKLLHDMAMTPIRNMR